MNRAISWSICPAVLLLLALSVRADMVEMQNGDRYSGEVISISSNRLVMNSEMLGKISVPRTKVAVLRLGDSPAALGKSTPLATPNPSSAPSATAGTNSDFATAMRGLGSNTNFIQQIRGQFLNGAGPEANQKFDDMLGSLMSGKMSMDDLRQQAQSSVDQLKALKHELGDNEASGYLDSYMEILQSFLNESASSPASANPNVPAAADPNSGGMK